MFKKTIFIICMLGTIALSFANNYYMKDELPIWASNTNGCDKSSSISASINGSILSVVFTENLGNVVIEIRDGSGQLMDFASIGTPNGTQFIITIEGYYTITFILPNGDEYYAEFYVSE